MGGEGGLRHWLLCGRHFVDKVRGEEGRGAEEEEELRAGEDFGGLPGEA